MNITFKTSKVFNRKKMFKVTLDDNLFFFKSRTK